MSVKVLIVDDMKHFLDLEASFLKRAECTVFKAINGLEALRIAKTEKPDIIFLDLEMPVMNGIECCRFIRADIELKDTPIVIVTASSREEECYKMGGSSYLRKPIDEDFFIAEIKKFVSIKERADPRVSVSLPVTADFNGTRTSGKAINISQSGLLLETEEPFTVGSKLTIDFSLPDVKGKIKTKSIVVREDKIEGTSSTGFGLSFLEISEKHQSAIDSFIAGQLKKQ